MIAGLRRAASIFAAIAVATALIPHAALAAPFGAQPGGDPKGTQVIMAAIAGRDSTYATPLVVSRPGDDLRFVNIDLFVHDVRSVAMGPDDTAWCRPPESDEREHPIRNPRRFPIGECPLLWTPPIALTNGAVESKVYGSRNLKPGTTVDFFCTVFPNMRGRVVVI